MPIIATILFSVSVSIIQPVRSTVLFSTCIRPDKGPFDDKVRCLRVSRGLRSRGLRARSVHRVQAVGHTARFSCDVHRCHTSPNNVATAQSTIWFRFRKHHQHVRDHNRYHHRLFITIDTQASGPCSVLNENQSNLFMMLLSTATEYTDDTWKHFTKRHKQSYRK